MLGLFCGERGIRTPGTLLYAGFQDQCIRPLCHLSKSGLQKYKYFQTIETLFTLITLLIIFQFINLALV